MADWITQHHAEQQQVELDPDDVFDAAREGWSKYSPMEGYDDLLDTDAEDDYPRSS
jgi:hypothetical protein